MSQDICFNIIACDLSMRRPGFALLQYDGSNRSVALQEKSNINNKGAKKCHGEILMQIGVELARYIKENEGAVIVREKALDIIRHSATTVEVLHKVVGVSDLYAWWLTKSEFDEVPVKRVKSLVANDQNAEKDQVAAALTQFVGDQTYECDDESDAVAVGIAWLIDHKFIDSPYQEKTK